MKVEYSQLDRQWIESANHQRQRNELHQLQWSYCGYRLLQWAQWQATLI